MSRIRLAALTAAAIVGVVLCAMPPAAAAPRQTGAEANDSADLTAQRRARIYVYPRRGPGPNSVRLCRSWLVQEYRVSGTVIVPRMQCWWQ